MKVFFALALLITSLTPGYAQQIAPLKKVGLWGVDLYTDGKGTYVSYGFAGRLIRHAYDEDRKIITSTYFDKDGSRTNGRITECKTYYYGGSEITHTAAVDNEKKVLTKVYYDKNGENKDYTKICNAYGEITSINFVDGAMDGAYKYQARYHGGNAESNELVTGTYKNNQKDGEWVRYYALDCAGTLNTWFEWINGSYDEKTITIYNNGDVVSTTTIK